MRLKNIKHSFYRSKRIKNIVYFIGINGCNVFKIGKTINEKSLIKRLLSIRQNNILPVFIHSYIYIADNSSVEKKLHRIFADKRIKNEWFSISIDDIYSKLEPRILVLDGRNIMNSIGKERIGIDPIECIQPMYTAITKAV